MRGYFDEDEPEPERPRRDREMTLGAGALLGLALWAAAGLRAVLRIGIRRGASHFRARRRRPTRPLPLPTRSRCRATTPFPSPRLRTKRGADAADPAIPRQRLTRARTPPRRNRARARVRRPLTGKVDRGREQEGPVRRNRCGPHCRLQATCRNRSADSAERAPGFAVRICS